MKTYLYTCQMPCPQPVSNKILWQEHGKWSAGFIEGKPYLIKQREYNDRVNVSGFFWFQLQTKGGVKKKFFKPKNPSYKTVIIDKSIAKNYLTYLKTL